MTRIGQGGEGRPRSSDRRDDSTTERWIDRHTASMLPYYRRPPVVFERGQGSYLWDVEGRRYLDLLAGIAVDSLGHGHPELTARVTGEFARLGVISGYFTSRPPIQLAERLLDLTGAPAGSRVFFQNSGAEAVELAVKIARATGRPRLLAFDGAFHGRTLGALALTANEDYRRPFQPLPGLVEHLPFGDIGALADRLDEDVAAVVVEVIQGEAGVRPLPDGVLPEIRRLTTRAGALLIVDEIQTGVGRTGGWFATDLDGFGPRVKPDIMTLAKGLGGGFPIGAVVAYGDRAAGLIRQGQHGTTFGGNPTAAVAGLTVLEIIERDGLLDHVRLAGRFVRDEIGRLDHPAIAGVRGAGLLLGIELSGPFAAAITEVALEHGFVVNAVAPEVVRLTPPLTIAVEELRTFTDALPAILDEALRPGVA